MTSLSAGNKNTVSVHRLLEVSGGFLDLDSFCCVQGY